ncbi:serine proteinase stubble-like [Amphibalanus amphitrite]|uniref:serine proteinase stubble-like n=1 Tax=Amphibalanus amphitrite TaxID=1232801 RepID=UPI001C91693D|nr:serine proteinase stubble-like [Amphibalanus amphitrite]
MTNRLPAPPPMTSRMLLMLFLVIAQLLGQTSGQLADVSRWDDHMFEAQATVAVERSLRPQLSAKEARPSPLFEPQDDGSPWERSASTPRRYVSPFQVARLVLQTLDTDTDVGAYGRFELVTGVTATLTSLYFPGLYPPYQWKTWQLTAEDEQATLRMTCDTYELGEGDRLVLRDSVRGRRTYYSPGDPPPDVTQPFILLELRSRSEGRLRCSVKAVRVEGGSQLGQVTPVSRPESAQSQPGVKPELAETKPSVPPKIVTPRPKPSTPAPVVTTQKPQPAAKPQTPFSQKPQKPKPAAKPRPPPPSERPVVPSEVGVALNQTRQVDRPVDLNDPICGKVQTNVRIVGGEVVPRKALPWMVGITSLIGRGPYCGGSIINERFILTAAHCVKNREASRISVLVRKYKRYRDEDQIRFYVKKIIKHPDYNKIRSDSDIAILELRDNLRELISSEDGRVRPICLPSAACGGGSGPAEACLTGRTSLIAGWGLLRQDTLDYPDVALQVELPVLSNDKCADDYANEPFVITSNMVCAGLPEGGKDTCQVSGLCQSVRVSGQRAHMCQVCGLCQSVRM